MISQTILPLLQYMPSDIQPEQVGSSRSVEWGPAQVAETAVGWDRGAGRQEVFIWMRGLGLIPVLSSFYPDCLPCIQLPWGEPEPHLIADASPR